MNIERSFKYLAVIYMVIFGIVMLFPVYWIIISSFKYETDIFNPFSFLPLHLTLSNFYPPYFDTNYFRWISNSLIVSLSAAAIVITLAIPSSYLLARERGFFNNLLSRSLILAYLFPAAFLVVGFVKLLTLFNLMNTHLGLILVYVAFTAPYVTYLFTLYMTSLPKELEEAMLVDGATKIHILLRLIVPLSAPIIIAGFIYTFTWSWNEVIYALTIVSSPHLLTAPSGLATLQPGESIIPWGTVFAFSTLYSIPPLIILLALQRYYMYGLTRGALKA